MPYIHLSTGTALSADTKTALKSRLAEAMTAAFPGKTESWLMIRLDDSCTMFFAGSEAPCVMVHMDIFGSQSDDAYDAMTSSVCAVVSEECGIPQNRIYVKYREVEHWGWNGGNF